MRINAPFGEAEISTEATSGGSRRADTTPSLKGAKPGGGKYGEQDETPEGVDSRSITR